MLKHRICTAVLLLVLMVLMLYCANGWIWAAFAGVVALMALWEYAQMLRFTLKQSVVYLVGTAAFMAMAYAGDWRLPALVWCVVLGFWGVMMPLWLRHKWVLGHMGVRSVVVGWLVFVPFWYALLMLRPEAGDMGVLLSLMVLVWVVDVFAYVFGKCWGRHKIAPSISPGKSWEGAWGGVLAVCVCMSALMLWGQNTWLGDRSWWGNMVISVVFAVLSVGGDLLESWFKRVAGIKDSGRVLPGHGGVFDRIDGLVAVLGVYAALVSLQIMVL